MSLFGESLEDQRDYRMGLAGLLAGTHALRILAEGGHARPVDIEQAVSGMRTVLDQIPTWREGERERLDEMLENLIAAARQNFGPAHG